MSTISRGVRFALAHVKAQACKDKQAKQKARAASRRPQIPGSAFAISTRAKVATPAAGQSVAAFRKPLRKSRSNRRVSAAARSVTQEQPPGWEHLLFGQILRDEYEPVADLRREYGLKLTLREGQLLDDGVGYHAAKFSDFAAAIRTFDALMKKPLQEAFGKDGPGDPAAIVHVARSFMRIYAYLIQWVLEVRSVRVTATYRRLIDLLGELPTATIEQLEMFLSSYQDLMNRLPGLIERGEPLDGLAIDINFDIELKTLSKELDVVLKRLGVSTKEVDRLMNGV